MTVIFNYLRGILCLPPPIKNITWVEGNEMRGKAVYVDLNRDQYVLLYVESPNLNAALVVMNNSISHSSFETLQKTIYQ